MYIDSSLRSYLDALAARTPAPGGGSASALAAAIGTGLIAMVANYTIGSAAYKDNEEKVASLLAEARRCDGRLRALIDEDAEAYAALSAGLKACGDDTARRDELYKAALRPPYEVCMIAFRCLELCRDLALYGNKRLITDTAIAANLFECAFFSAKFNVYINLECVKDTGYIAGIHKVLLPLEEKVPQIKEEVIELCEEVINDRTCQ